MSLRGWATAAFCVLATPGALAQKAAPPDPTSPSRAQPAAEGQARNWPRLLPDKSSAEPKPTPAAWSREEIELAQARCTALLKNLDVVAVPETPLREGSECGTPAPMKLISVGKGGQIALSPPPILTCDMIVALHKWLERDVQPLARKHLGAPVIRIESMSSYSCRNAYGRANSRLSEHGRANALDIGSFVTARGQTAMVVADWGPTARDIQAAAAKAEAERTVKIDPGQSPGQPKSTASARQRPNQPSPPVALGFQPGSAISIPGLTIDMPGAASDRSLGLGLTPPSRLGGPKPAAPVLPGNKMDFLRGAHRTACKIFGTVLGPEANNAHKNHFHVDMAERKLTAICE
jgi:hypothetical protein